VAGREQTAYVVFKPAETWFRRPDLGLSLGWSTTSQHVSQGLQVTSKLEDQARLWDILLEICQNQVLLEHEYWIPALHLQ
jgi:hypothetical protein